MSTQPALPGAKPSDPSDQLPVVRNEHGQFPKGVSGNPAGRQKGSRNHLVNLQRDLEIAVREHLRPERVLRIVNKLAEMAEGGHVGAMKLLLDKIVANAAPATDEDTQNNGRTVVFKIVNATFAAEKKAPIQGEVIDAEIVSTRAAVLDS